LLLAGSGFASLSRLPAIALGTIFLLALLIANGQTLLNIYGMLSGHLRNDPGDQRPAALALRPTPEHRVIVDVNQARYLFDYHIPPGVLSFEYAATFPIAYADEELRPSDLYILGPQSVDSINQRNLPMLASPPRWNPLGGTPRYGFNEFPHWVYIISGEECKKTKRDK
jgi:hypothetical protein